MATWNQFAEEVREERRTVRAYGVEKVNERVRVDSYKAQALRELALRLELQSELDEVKRQLADMVDKLEAANVPF